MLPAGKAGLIAIDHDPGTVPESFPPGGRAGLRGASLVVKLCDSLGLLDPKPGGFRLAAEGRDLQGKSSHRRIRRERVS